MMMYNAGHPFLAILSLCMGGVPCSRLPSVFIWSIRRDSVTLALDTLDHAGLWGQDGQA